MKYQNKTFLQYFIKLLVFGKKKPTKYQFLPYNTLYITVIMYKDEFIFIDVLYHIYD